MLHHFVHHKLTIERIDREGRRVRTRTIPQGQKVTVSGQYVLQLVHRGLESLASL